MRYQTVAVFTEYGLTAQFSSTHWFRHDERVDSERGVFARTIIARAWIMDLYCVLDSIYHGIPYLRALGLRRLRY